MTGPHLGAATDHEAGRWMPWIGLGVALVSAVILWLFARGFDAGRGDFFYLADAFLHGRTWLDVRLGQNDVIVVDGRIYVPFAPFPAVALMPLVALIGPVTADQVESGVNAVLAGIGVAMGWWLLGRLGVRRVIDRLWLVVLFAFSTQILWATARGGVWHTGHLVATILTLGCLIEVAGRRRAWLIGLLAGAAFMTRAPLAFAIPLYVPLLVTWTSEDADSLGWLRDRAALLRTGLGVAVGALPALIAFFAYNVVRFGTPFESGYALATVPEFLERQRALGLFSLAHLPMNIDYFLLHLPRLMSTVPFLRPDGLGLSVLLTSPGLLLAFTAPFRSQRTWWLAILALATLLPSLLYYGGGWLQYGYRYFLDSMPFVWALCGLGVAAKGRLTWPWRLLIVVGVVVMMIGAYWVYAF